MKLFWFTLALTGWASVLQAQIEGRWKTIDDNSGQPKSIVEITQHSNRFFGKVVKVFQKAGENPDPICDKCAMDDARYNKKVIGMEILQDIVQEGDTFVNGQILDPENGKVYRCKLWLEGKVLKVRGYWGPFFRTQDWYRDN